MFGQIFPADSPVSEEVGDGRAVGVHDVLPGVLEVAQAVDGGEDPRVLRLRRGVVAVGLLLLVVVPGPPDGVLALAVRTHFIQYVPHETHAAII